MSPNADGSGGRLYRDSDEVLATTESGIPLVRLDGAFAVWEWVDETRYVDPATLRFGMVITAKDRKQLTPGDVLVRGGLAPFFPPHALPGFFGEGADRRQVAVIPCFLDILPTKVAFHIE